MTSMGHCYFIFLHNRQCNIAMTVYKYYQSTVGIMTRRECLWNDLFKETSVCLSYKC